MPQWYLESMASNSLSHVSAMLSQRFDFPTCQIYTDFIVRPYAGGAEPLGWSLFPGRLPHIIAVARPSVAAQDRRRPGFFSTPAVNMAASNIAMENIAREAN